MKQATATAARFIAISAMAVMTWCGSASADVVLFDNFGPNDEYDTNVGWTIGTDVDWQLGAGFVMNAGGNHLLNSVTASIRHVAGQNLVTLSIYDTVGGVPGNLLETSFAMDLPPHDGTDAPPTTFGFSGATTLLDGETYWVIASTDGPGGSWLAWNWNIDHTLGLHGQRQGDGEWQVFNFEQSVMRVTGTLIPTPGVLAMLGVSMIGLGRRSRRR